MELSDYQNILHAFGFTLKIDFDVSHLGESVSSSVVLLETNEVGTVVVKESNWYQFLSPADAKNALEAVYAVSEKLLDRGVFVPKAYIQTNGSFVYATGQTFFVVQQHLHGEAFAHSDAHIELLGKTLAQFHKVGKEVLMQEPDLQLRIQNTVPTEKPYEESRSIYEEAIRPVLVRDHECALTEVCSVVKSDIAFIETCMARVDKMHLTSSSFTQTILHNDLNTRNILFSEGCSFGKVIDVDQLGVGSCVLDIANTLNSFTWKFVEENPQCIEEKTALYLRGYHSVNPLPLPEYLAITQAGLRWDLLRILRSLRRHHFENNRFPELTQNIKKRFLPRLHKTSEQFSFVTETWLQKILL